MKSFDWKAFAAAVLAAILAVLGGRQLPQPGTPTDPNPKPLPDAKPSQNPVDAIGRLVMSGGYCSATPVTPLGKDRTQTVLTAAHCATAIGEVCQFYTRSGRMVKVTVKAINRDVDACLMTTEPLTEALPYLLVATETPSAGTAVFHAGFGIDNPGNVEKGKVLSPNTGHGQAMYELSVSPGDSGGGICVDSSGAILSPVCCTTRLAAVGQVYGARPEEVRKMLVTPAAFVGVPPVQMPMREEKVISQ